MSEEREGGGTGACCQVFEPAVCTDGAGGRGPVHRDTAPPTDSHERQLCGTEGQVTGEREKRERERGMNDYAVWIYIVVDVELGFWSMEFVWEIERLSILTERSM